MPIKRLSPLGTEDSDEVRSFEVLFREWSPLVWRVADRFLGSPVDADDVVQNVFAKLWSRKEWKVPVPWAYFTRAARNEVIELLRRRHRRAEVPMDRGVASRLPHHRADPEREALRRRRNELLPRMLESLPPQCGRVMGLIYEEGMSRREVAEKLGITVKAVEKQVTRGYRLLRERSEIPVVREWLSTFEDGGGAGPHHPSRLPDAA